MTSNRKELLLRSIDRVVKLVPRNGTGRDGKMRNPPGSKQARAMNWSKLGVNTERYSLNLKETDT